VNEVIGRVRELSQSLRPAVLDDLGLLPALVSFFGRYKRQTGIEIRFEHRGVERRRFGPEIETAAYRIVQEALTNVARHAHVHVAQVRVWAGDTRLGVQIEDDGPGFDSETMFTNGNSQGLAGMRERAALLSGELMVDTAPGSGCRVTAELPITGGGP
jgi:signal transduction histidine kinase